MHFVFLKKILGIFSYLLVHLLSTYLVSTMCQACLDSEGIVVDKVGKISAFTELTFWSKGTRKTDKSEMSNGIYILPVGQKCCGEK